MDTSNTNKTIEQKKALNQWAANKFIGSIIAGTGFGKSRCGVLAIKYAFEHKYNLDKYGTKALILVPTVQLQDQFRNEFDKWVDDLSWIDNVDIMCYQSAYKLKDQHYDIVVCDEIHLGLSKKYRKFFENNTYYRLLCMTATLPEEEEYRLLLYKLAPTVYTITLDKCVELGIVSPYEINCIPVQLTDEERAEYQTINSKFVKCKYALGQYDAFNNAKFIMGNPNAHPDDKRVAAQFYQAIRERKAIVDFAENKIGEFQMLVGRNTHKKILAFSGANDFTDQLSDSVSPLAVAYHSKKTKKKREAALELFRNDEINILCSTKALNQGLDIPNANMGIICGLTSKSLSMIQRIGRLIRFQEGKVGSIYILYVENSQEEKWLKSSVKNLDNINWL